MIDRIAEKVFNTFHIAHWDQKLNFSLNLVVFFAPVMMFIEKYIFNDWDFMISLSILIFLDTISGSAAAFKEGKFKPTIGAGKFLIKLIALTVTVFCIGVIDNVRIGGADSFYANFVDKGAFAIMMGFEGASILKNVYRVYPFEIIKHLLKKFNIFYSIEDDKVEGNEKTN